MKQDCGIEVRMRINPAVLNVAESYTIFDDRFKSIFKVMQLICVILRIMKQQDHIEAGTECYIRR